MKIVLLVVGKTVESYFIQGIEEYSKRLAHYVPFEIAVIPELRNTKSLSTDQQKARDADFILKSIIGAARRHVPNAGARLVSPVISMSLERLTSLPMSANATTSTVAATIIHQRISFGSILMNRNHSGRNGNRKP